MIVLFWDIDGTLLTTGKAGVPAWEQAVREIVRRDFQLSSFRVAGLTDYQIAVRTFEMLDVAVDEATIRKMVGRYEALLPQELPKKEGRVLPNVREILEHMRGRSDVRSYLLTGNTRGGARAKLTHYNLFHYFIDGAFAEDAGARDDSRAGPSAGSRRRSHRRQWPLRRRRYAARHRVCQRDRCEDRRGGDGRLLARRASVASAVARLRRVAGGRRICPSD